MAEDERGGPAAPSRRSLVAVVILWMTVMVSVSLAAGCFGHNCDGDTANYGGNPGEGHLIDPDTWESTPVDSPWLAFPKQRVWYFDLQALGEDRVPYEYTPYVSAEPNPLKTGDNFTVASGNITQESGVAKGRLVLQNNTCADYFLRVVVRAPPRTAPSASATPTTPSPSDSGAGDAGSDADSGP